MKMIDGQSNKVCEKDPTKQVEFDLNLITLAPGESYDEAFHRVGRAFLERNKVKKFTELHVFDDVVNLRFHVFAYGVDTFSTEECSVLYVPYKTFYSQGIEKIKPSWDLLQSAHQVFSDELIKLLFGTSTHGKPSGYAVFRVSPTVRSKDKGTSDKSKRSSDRGEHKKRNLRRV